jgi:hypothetical protein
MCKWSWFWAIVLATILVTHAPDTWEWLRCEYLDSGDVSCDAYWNMAHPEARLSRLIKISAASISDRDLLTSTELVAIPSLETTVYNR